VKPLPGRSSVPIPQASKRFLKWWKLDLSSLASVRDFGQRADKELNRLDIVVS
jgi:hypothetical protein